MVLACAAAPSPATAAEQMRLAQASPDPVYSATRPQEPKASSDNWIPAAQAAGVGHSAERYPGPKAGPSNWIPASAAPAQPGTGSDDRGAHPYSQHGTGPYPN
ncbi:MAG: hypothetical protein WA417_17630 [Stellaceae bacterium]